MYGVMAETVHELLWLLFKSHLFCFKNYNSYVRYKYTAALFKTNLAVTKQINACTIPTLQYSSNGKGIRMASM